MYLLKLKISVFTFNQESCVKTLDLFFITYYTPFTYFDIKEILSLEFNNFVKLSFCLID